MEYDGQFTSQAVTRRDRETADYELDQVLDAWQHRSKTDVDGRDKPGHDEKQIIFKQFRRDMR